MKGVVFVALADMMQEKYGHHFWNNVINESNLESKGIFTSAANYNDQEAIKLLSIISNKIGKPTDVVLKIFGIYLLKFFSTRYPQFFENKNLLSFYTSLDNIVHVEIKKLAPEVTPPQVLVKEIISNNEYILTYRSPRKLCPLAIGLIKGASHYYRENIEIEHTICMNAGHDSCEYLIRVK